MFWTKSHRPRADAQWGYIAYLTMFLCYYRHILTAFAEEGFISIDCGRERSYTDHGLSWQRDKDFVQGGTVGNIMTNASSWPPYLRHLRYFPTDSDSGDDSASCYYIPVADRRKYLVRATFLYGNYDNKSSPPIFELQVGLTPVATIQTTLNDSQQYEVIIVPRSGNLSVCLNRIQAENVPFISSLETRQLTDDMYAAVTPTSALITVLRLNFGVKSPADTLRWPDDAFDRIWQSDTSAVLPDQSEVHNVLTYELISHTPEDAPNQPPDPVLQTALVMNAKYETLNLSIPFFSNSSFLYLAAYFSTIMDSSTRQMVLKVNDFVRGPAEVQPLEATEVTFRNLPELAGTISLNITDMTGNGAYINGLELYRMGTVSVLTGTHDLDRSAVGELLHSFHQLDNYSGDPCTANWDWVTCSGPKEGLYRIVTVNLSSRNLTGVIPIRFATSPLILENLWLDNNNLRGRIPDFSSLRGLKTLRLQNNSLRGGVNSGLANLDLAELFIQNNKLSGNIPETLFGKNGLDFRFEGNPGLCLANDTCGRDDGVGRSAGSPAQAPSKKKHLRALVVAGVAVGVILALVVTVLLCVLVYCCYLQKRPKDKSNVSFHNKPNSTGIWQRISCPRLFRLYMPPRISHSNSVGNNISKVSVSQLNERGNPVKPVYNASGELFRPVEIKKATRNYMTKIGEGGYGPVYYGKLPNNLEIAVKVRSNNSRQGAREFATEVEILSRAKHPNVVSLIGNCQEAKDYMLVYEFLGGGTLQEHLYGICSNKPLDWKTRLKIAVDAAKGLEYLHVDCVPTIIHRDIKSSNILLTSNFDAKVADFGLSKLLEEHAAHVSTIVKGTCGYLDPEYYQSERLTHKSDVYSFGVVLLEIITGREPLNTKLPKPEWKITDWTRDHLAQGDLDSVVDVKLSGYYNIQSMWKVAELAMTCVEPRSVHRPAMNEVVTELQAATEIEDEGHTVLDVTYYREDPYLLDPSRRYKSQSFGRISSSRKLPRRSSSTSESQ